MTQRPDTTTARNTGSDFQAHSEGQHAMTCVDVINLGYKVEQFQDNPAREVEKAALVFASGERNEDRTLRLVTAEMTVSMHEKSNMRAFLESWRGKSFTPQQVEQGVPLHKLWGVNGLFSIEHITTRQGRTFAKIRSVSPLPKAMPAPVDDLAAEYVRPDFFEDRKREYAEGIKKFRAEAGLYDGEGGPLPDEEYATGDDTDDSVPF